jgi:hypothetical protein
VCTSLSSPIAIENRVEKIKKNIERDSIKALRLKHIIRLNVKRSKFPQTFKFYIYTQNIIFNIILPVCCHLPSYYVEV